MSTTPTQEDSSVVMKVTDDVIATLAEKGRAKYSRINPSWNLIGVLLKVNQIITVLNSSCEKKAQVEITEIKLGKKSEHLRDLMIPGSEEWYEQTQEFEFTLVES